MTGQQQPIAYRHVLYLLLSLAMVTAPHVLHLPWWITALAVVLFAWRAHLGHALLGCGSQRRASGPRHGLQALPAPELL